MRTILNWIILICTILGVLYVMVLGFGKTFEYLADPKNEPAINKAIYDKVSERYGPEVADQWQSGEEIFIGAENDAGLACLAIPLMGSLLVCLAGLGLSCAVDHFFPLPNE